MSADENPELLAELIEEWQERLRRGERPDVEEYARKHPALAEEIRQLLPGLAALENLKGDALDRTIAPTAGMPVVEGGPVLERLGDFRILREVGRGGMGVVYEAEQVSLGRRVALKVLPQKVILDSRQKRRFEREARAAAKLHHTNIVPVFGVGEYEGMPYYVMQFIQGLGLDAVADEIRNLQGQPARPRSPDDAPTVTRHDVSAAVVARSLMTGEFEPGPESDAEPDSEGRRKPESSGSNASSATPLGSGTYTASSVSLNLPGRDPRAKPKKQSYWESVATIGAQVADALEHAHSQGILHRDIKPSNLLLDTRGTVWVTDFGLAKASDHQDDLTHTGDILGTLRYMPPEAFEGKSDARGDVYSLGLTLYELLAQRPAFNEKDRHQLIRLVTTSEPERLDRLNAAIPRDLVTIIHKAIDREAGRRYQTARELASDLERFLANEPILARQAGPWERTIRWVRKKPAAAALIGMSTVATVAVAGVIAVLMYSSKLEDAKHAAEAAHQEAVEARLLAEQSRDAEAVQRHEAEVARHSEATQRQAAEAARAEAVKQKGLAEQQREAAILQRGKLAVLTESWPEAEKDLGGYVKRHPKSLEAWLGLAKAQAKLGKPANAIEAYSQAISLAPQTNANALVEGYTARAEQQAARGKTNEAIADYEAAFALKPILSDHAAPFARALHTAAAGWTILEPTKAEASSGTIEIRDGSVLLPDNTSRGAETFVIEAPVGLKELRSLRMELLGQLSNDPKSTYHYMNFQVSEMTVELIGKDGKRSPVPLAKAWTDSQYNQSYYGSDSRTRRVLSHPWAAIDGDKTSTWYYYSYQNNQNSVAVFEAGKPVPMPDGARLAVTLHFTGNSPSYRSNSLSRFRLSVHSGEANAPLETAMLSTQLSGWLKLALARHFRGEEEAAAKAFAEGEKSGGSNSYVKFLRAIIVDDPAQKSKVLEGYNEALDTMVRQRDPHQAYGPPDRTPYWLAVAASSAWIEREPMNGAFRRNRAEVYLALEQWADAAADYDELIRREPEDFRLHYDRGECRARLGLDSCDADFARAAELNPDETLALHLKRMTNANNIPARVELAHLKAALALEKGKPGEADLLVRRGRHYSNEGQWDKARPDLDAALKINPALPEAFLERGAVRLAQEDSTGAKVDFAEARKLNPQTAIQWHSQRLYSRPLSKTKPEEALLHIAETLACEPPVPVRSSLLAQRATLHRQAKRWAEAVADYTRIIELNPKSAIHLLARAECYCAINDLVKARADLDDALKQSRGPTLQNVRASLQTQLSARNWAAVVLFADVILGGKPAMRDEVEALERRAAANVELERFAESQADCARLIDLQPGSAVAFKLMARLTDAECVALQLQGKPEAAKERLKQARLALEKHRLAHPENAGAALALAECLLLEAADWRILDPQQFKSVGGATLTRQPDGSLLASGTNPPSDVYLLRDSAPHSGVRAIRLEALPDSSLPRNGPGRAENDNFLVSEFQIRSGARRQDIARVISGTDTRETANRFPARDAIDGRSGTGWGMTGVSSPTAVFSLAAPTTGRDPLLIAIHSGGPNAGNLGRFRISVSNSPYAQVAEELRGIPVNTWLKLAVARLLLDDRAGADRALQKALRNAKGVTGPNNLILLAWLQERLGEQAAAGETRRAFVQQLRTRNEKLPSPVPIPVPTLALDLLQHVDDLADAQVLALWRARVHDLMGDMDAAAAEYLKALDPQNPPAGLLAERSEFFRRIHSWKHAAADYRQRAEHALKDPHIGLETAPLLVLAGDHEGYAKLREMMLPRFDAVESAFHLEQAAKACALMPLPPEQAKRLVAMTQKALTSGQKLAPFELHFVTAHGLNLYRAGDYKSAIEQCRKALTLVGDGKGRSAPMGVLAPAVQALAHHKLGQTAEAERCYQQARAATRELPDLDHTHPTTGFHDVHICLLLLEEAKQVIAPGSPARAPAPRESASLDEAAPKKQ
jgi:serine/threonine protein kinase/Tfp pilus assembly protein PilF